MFKQKTNPSLIMPTPTDQEKLLKQTYGDNNVWNTEQLQKEFKVESFLAPLCIVHRKSDNQKGTVEFIHSPRFYFNFKTW